MSLRFDHHLSVCLIVLFALLTVCLINQRSHAMQEERVFRPGERVEVGGGMSVKILACRGEGNNQECEVQYYRGEAPESTPRWENALFLRTAEARVLNYKKQEAAAQPEKNNPPADTPEETVDKTDKTAAKDCSFATPVADVSKTAKPSEELFKRKIYDNYHVLANGTNSAPLRVGVTFLSFQLGKPFTNVVRVDPGRGAYRINDAAPPNAVIHPVTSKHIVCDEYRDRTLRRQVENKYACFKNRDGEWVCGADGIPRTTQLN